MIVERSEMGPFGTLANAIGWSLVLLAYMMAVAVCLGICWAIWWGTIAIVFWAMNTLLGTAMDATAINVVAASVLIMVVALILETR